MRSKIIIVTLLFLTLTTSANATPDLLNMARDFLSKARTYLSEKFGHEYVEKIMGEDEVTLPEIPKLSDDTKSTAIYNKKELSNAKAPTGQQKQQLDYLFIKELFITTKLREATENDLGIWYNTLTQGGSREGVYRAMVLDAEYYELETKTISTSKSAIDFSIYFLETFINQKIDANSLKKPNFFSMKREITERALSIIDLFENQNDLAKWYAVFSGYVAIKYTEAWTNDLRKNSSKMAHLRWAMSVPVEHIKSETYIKIHQVMNYLSAP